MEGVDCTALHEVEKELTERITGKLEEEEVPDEELFNAQQEVAHAQMKAGCPITDVDIQPKSDDPSCEDLTDWHDTITDVNVKSVNDAPDALYTEDIMFDRAWRESQRRSQVNRSLAKARNSLREQMSETTCPDVPEETSQKQKEPITVHCKVPDGKDDECLEQHSEMDFGGAGVTRDGEKY